jgi:hypothetical protein
VPRVAIPDNAVTALAAPVHAFTDASEMEREKVSAGRG